MHLQVITLQCAAYIGRTVVSAGKLAKTEF